MSGPRRVIRVGEHEVDITGLIWEHPDRATPRLSLLPVVTPGGYPSPLSTSSVALVQTALAGGLDSGALGWATAIAYVSGLGRLVYWLPASGRMFPGATWDLSQLDPATGRAFLAHVKGTLSKSAVSATKNAIICMYAQGVKENAAGFSSGVLEAIEEIGYRDLGSAEAEGGAVPPFEIPVEPGIPALPTSFECGGKLVRIEGLRMVREDTSPAVGLERIVRPAGRPSILSRRAQQLALLYTLEEIAGGSWPRHQILNAVDRFSQWLAWRPEWRTGCECFDWPHLTSALAGAYFEAVRSEPKGRDWWIFLRSLYRWGVSKGFQGFNGGVERELMSIGFGRALTLRRCDSEEEIVSRFVPDPDLPPIPPSFSTPDQKHTIRTASPIWRRYDESGQPLGAPANFALLDDPPTGPEEAIFSRRFLHIVRLYIVWQASKRWSWETITSFLSMLRDLQAWLRTSRQMAPNSFDVEHLRFGLLAAYKMHLESDAGPGYSGRLSMLRELYRQGLQRRLTGFSAETMARLKELEFTNNPRGEVVRAIDPVKGAFSMTEQAVLKDVLEDPDWGTVEEKALVRLCWYLGPRPVQIAALRVKYLEKYVSPHGITYVLRVPRAKKGVPTEQTVARGIPSDYPLGQLLEELNPPGTDPERELFPSLVGKLDKGAAITALLKRWAHRGGPRPLRTHRVLEGGEPALLTIHPYRFRRTMATNLARQRASAEYIAHMLDDDDLRMAIVYTENISRIVSVLGESLDAGEYLDIMGGFFGEFETEKDRSLPVIQPVAVDGPGREAMLDLGGTGRCGKGALCNLAWPMSCYPCPKFKPREGGPHEQMLANMDATIANARRHGSSRMIVVYQHIRERIAIVVEVERRRRATAITPQSKENTHENRP